MIQVMAVMNTKNNRRIVFKLTEPQDNLDGEMGEFLTDRTVRLGLGGNVFRALGYKWGGGHEDANGVHRFWYRNVERDRFKDGPLYYELVLTTDEKPKIIRANRMAVTADSTIDPIPLPEFTEVV